MTLYDLRAYRPNLLTNCPIEPIMTNPIPGTCRHFVSYSGVKLPFNLVNPLEPHQLGNRNTYFRGYYDAQERLVGLEKVVYGEIELVHRYAYHDHGPLKQAEITDVDGEVTVLAFDAQGEPVSA